MTDQAEAAEITPTPRKKRDPAYDVFEMVEIPAELDPRGGSPGEATAWVLIASGLIADNAKQAIILAVKDRVDDDQYGTFWAQLAGRMKPRTRVKKTIVEDVWE